MKTTKVLLLGAVVAAFSFTSFAAEPLLSPRAKDNQSKVVAGIVNNSNRALACRNNMNGTPKAVSECVSHTTMPGCLTVAELK